MKEITVTLKLDEALLSQQKLTLIYLFDEFIRAGDERADDILGLLHLLDAIEAAT